MFADGVVVDIDVFYLVMSLLSFGHTECQLQVTVDFDRVVKGKTNLLVELVNLCCLLRTHIEGNVLCLCCGSGNGGLLLTTP